MLRLTQLVLVVVFALNQVGSDVPQKIFVTVYYESKCPDSKHFIIKQLQPTINLLHKYLMLRLVPFGKARSNSLRQTERNGDSASNFEQFGLELGCKTESIDNGHNGFQCQHGPSECAGNVVQSCALDLMQGRSDMEKVSYVACEMQRQAGTRGDMECVLSAGVRVDEVQQCVHSGKGISLQLEDEYLTKQVRPKFIPTVTIDGIFNQEVQDSSLHDFTGTLCSIFTNIPPCLEYHNSIAMHYVLL